MATATATTEADGATEATAAPVSDNEKFDLTTDGADRVEIKITVLEKQEPIAIAALGLDPAKASGRSIYFYDTRVLALYKTGVILRARQIEGEPPNSTVKVRPVEPEAIDTQWFEAPGFKLEADAVGEKVIRSASLSAEQGPDEIQQVAWKKRAISKLFSPDQERFLAAMHSEPVDLDKLEVLGPIPALRQDVVHPAIVHKICAELWRLPDGGHLVELSIKCPREEANIARRIFEGFLAGIGLDPHGSQDTKTRRALNALVGRGEGA